MKARFRADPWLLLGFLILLLSHLPYLPSSVQLRHDTLSVFHFFHACHSELLFHGEWPGWMPYVGRGISSDVYQLHLMTPMSYLALLAGWLLGVTDSLLLFKLSILGERMVLFLGGTLLARKLFGDPRTAFVVATALVLGVPWDSNLFLSLRPACAVPWIFLCLLEFFDRRSGAWFWAAVLCGLLWSAQYFTLAVTFLVSLVFFIPLAWRNPSALKSLVAPRWTNAAAFGGVLLVVLLVLGPVAFGAAEGVELNIPGRTAGGGVGLTDFLTYGGNLGIGELLHGFLVDTPPYLPLGSGRDVSVYTGLLPVAFMGFALARNRRPSLLVLTAVCAFLVAFSVGGILSALVYYLVPGFSVFRHVGFVHSVTRVVVVLAAGFGIRRFLEQREGGARAAWIVLGLYVFYLHFELALLSHREGGLNGGYFRVLTGAQVGAVPMLLRVLVFSGCILVAFRRGLRFPALAAALLVDLALAQVSCMRTVERMPPGADPQALRAHPPAWVARRTPEPESARGREAFRLVSEQVKKRRAVYAVAWAFIQHDPAEPRFRTDLVPEGTARLVSSRPGGDPALARILGRDAPKLRLRSGVRTAPDAAAAAALLRELAEPDEVVVITDPGGEVAERPASAVEGTVTVTSFTANRVVAEVDVRSGGPAWLVYADGHHPDWTARIDGGEVPVRRAYLAFKAVEVPAGRHEVVFAFRPGWGRAGSWMLILAGAAASIGVVVLAGVLAARREPGA